MNSLEATMFTTPASTHTPTLHRRAFLGRQAGALGGLALASLLAEEAHADADDSPREHPLAPRPSHHRPRATSVICLFQHGGPSQMDLLDPKPELNRLEGKAYPGELEVHIPSQLGKITGSPFAFSPQGQCGMELSELLPHTGRIADQITLVRSMTTTSVDHDMALRMIHTGKTTLGRPTWGSWVLYGLGSERRDLPAYVVLADPAGLPMDGVRNWTAGFLPAIYQGTPFRASGRAMFNLETPADLTPTARDNQLRLLRRLNEIHRRRDPRDENLAARIENYELAAKLQTSVPDLTDLSDETGATRRLYGLDDDATAEYGRRCLVARRLVERGVRFVQVFLYDQPWDTHRQNNSRVPKMAARVDRPGAALVEDLRRRGLLESTIVLWTGEFGRLPVSQGRDGRDHNRHGFSLWLAGGGFKAGHVHGQTDDFGYRAVENALGVNDLHATLLDSLGLDHERLTWPHAGRDDSLTDSPVTGARVVKELYA